MSRIATRTFTVLLALVCVGIALSGVPALAQAEFAAVRGKLTNTQGEPLRGYRIVFEPLSGSNTYLSEPTQADGSYLASMPSGLDVIVVGVVDPQGQRRELSGQRPFAVDDGRPRNLQIDAAVAVERPGREVAGTLTDENGEPIQGFRLVLQALGTTDIALGTPSGADGSFEVLMADQVVYKPIAAIAPGGRRIDIPDAAVVQAGTGAGPQVAVPQPFGRVPLRQPSFPGGDRLFQFFIEDPSIVDNVRLELQYQASTFESDTAAPDTEVDVIRLVAAKQFKALPNLEVGGRIGTGDVDTPQPGRSGTGLTDFDLWAKLRYDPDREGVVWSPGLKIQFPTGDDDSGLSADSLAIKAFAAARRAIRGGSLSYHVAVEFNEDGRVGSRMIDGKVAPSTGLAYVYDSGKHFSWVSELLLGMERFEDRGADIRLSTGMNWRLPDRFSLRLAVVGGLADGSPDTQVLFGAAFQQ